MIGTTNDLNLSARTGSYTTISNLKNFPWEKDLFHSAVTIFDPNGKGLWTDPFLEENLDILNKRMKEFINRREKNKNANTLDIKYMIKIIKIPFQRKWFGKIIFSSPRLLSSKTYSGTSLSEVQHKLLQYYFDSIG